MQHEFQHAPSQSIYCFWIVRKWLMEFIHISIEFGVAMQAYIGKG